MGERRISSRRVEAIEPHYLGLGQLFDRSPDAVIVGEAGSGRVVLWNPAASRMFGYSQEEAVGLLIEDLVPQGLKEQHRAGMAKYAETGRGPLLDAGEPLELPARRKDGSEIQVELSLSPVENGRLSGRYVLAIARDVTERRRTEQTLRALEAERSAFIANAAHELRTPLTTICGYVSLLADRRHELGEEEQNEFFDTLKRAGDRVNTLIANLLDLSRIEHGAAHVELQAVGLRDAVGGALEISPPPAGVRVEVDVPPSITAQADPDRLNQIIVNLVTNAYRYGGRNIRFEAGAEGDRVELWVTDDGSGVPGEMIPHLFEPFTRGANARALQGSGLGLTITQRLVEMVGGEIAYEDARPGARFRVRFPTSTSGSAVKAP